jgi:hypothetical protein
MSLKEMTFFNKRSSEEEQAEKSRLNFSLRHLLTSNLSRESSKLNKRESRCLKNN